MSEPLSQMYNDAVVFLMKAQNILSLLEGKDRRSIGAADRVVAMVSKDPKQFTALIAGMWSADGVVRMRAADAAEKVSRSQPQLLHAHKRELLGLLVEAREKELRWHLAAMTPRLNLNAAERGQVVEALTGYLEDQSSIVKTFALQGLADLAAKEPNLTPAVVEKLREATRNGTAAMKARARKLLLRMEQG
jgi:hypothetical protein